MNQTRQNDEKIWVRFCTIRSKFKPSVLLFYLFIIIYLFIAAFTSTSNKPVFQAFIMCNLNEN